jgi:hypothetical protein
MRRLPVVAATAAAVALAPLGSGGVSLPLRSPQPPTSPLLAMASGQQGWRLEQIDASTFATVRSAPGPGWEDGWVVSPDRKLLAVATHADANQPDVSTLRFVNVSTLRWVRRGAVRLDGYFRAALWPRPGRVIALAGNCCGPGAFVDVVDTVAKKAVSRTPITDVIGDVERSADSLVALEETANAIAPVRVLIVGPDGGIRSVRIDRILGGSHYDQTSNDPIGSIRQPGLAVDPEAGIAYVVDESGLVAAVRLSDLAVSYHEPAHSLLARLAGWVTPTAQTKGLNGPMLAAQSLGGGMIAVTGQDASAIRQKDGTTLYTTSPAGLRIVDTNDWSERVLDEGANTAVVADGVLLVSGGSWRSEGSSTTSPGTTTSTGEGLVAYGSDGSVRWRLDAGANVAILAAYGTRALAQRIDAGTVATEPVQLIDLADGHTLATLPANGYPWPLLGTGSP